MIIRRWLQQSSVSKKFYILLSILSVSLLTKVLAFYLIVKGGRTLLYTIMSGTFVADGFGLVLVSKLTSRADRASCEVREAKHSQLRAEESNRIKSLFLANMSHEIRSPLGAILGFVELLMDPAISDHERHQYLEIIKRTGDSLATIVDDILDLSKVEAGKLETVKVPCNLPRLLQEIEQLLGIRCHNKKIYLRCHIAENLPEWVHTDPLRLRQILLNIIGNAIKFTNDGGVTVSCFMEPRTIVFVVSDTGIGIAKESTGKLFVNFSQIDMSFRKNQGGTGLGLILSRKLAQLLDGDVCLEQSLVGVGSTFVIRIALNPAEAVPEIISGGKPEIQLRGSKVFLVDDSPENQLLIQKFLAKTGAEVKVASDGLEGLNRALNEPFDIILMDMQMPVMDGYTATEKLRRGGYNRPILGLTAHAMKEDLAKALGVGCNEVLTKPINRNQLLESLSKYFSSSSV